MWWTKFILEVVKRLKQKVEVEIFIQNWDPRIIKKFTDEWIKVHNLNSLSTNKGLFWLFFPFFCKKHSDILQQQMQVWKFDTVITSMFPMNYIATKLKGLKIYQYCYEPFALFRDKEMISNYRFSRRCILYVLKMLYWRFDKIWVKGSKQIFTLSNVTKEQIKHVYWKESVITYEGVDTDFFKPTINKTIFEKYKNYNIIFHTTDFTPIKRTDVIFDLLPDIVEKVPNVKVLISSTVVDEKEIKKYTKSMEKKGLKNHFEFLGFLEYDKLPVYYTLAKVSLQPSVNQPQSLPVKEALACWTPVIRWYAKEVEFDEKDKVWFCIDINDRKLLLEKIIECLNYNKTTRREISMRARKLVMEKFTWESVTNKIYFNL